jgi:hypothetical protein
MLKGCDDPILGCCPPGRFRKPGQLRPLRPFFFIECKNSPRQSTRPGLSRRVRLFYRVHLIGEAVAYAARCPFAGGPKSPEPRVHSALSASPRWFPTSKEAAPMWEEHALADKPPAVSARWEHFAQIGQKRLKNVLTRRLASIVINLNACSVPEDLKWSGALGRYPMFGAVVVSPTGSSK